MRRLGGWDVQEKGDGETPSERKEGQGACPCKVQRSAKEGGIEEASSQGRASAGHEAIAETVEVSLDDGSRRNRATSNASHRAGASRVLGSEGRTIGFLG